ncbi:hypothetical protein [Sphingobium indicum]|uniref:Uncharacterized protein n=1 Tax=Sphingobium indicum (strain DSM 16412 / CCM 7286 / MTCC 6364 / B90A) TaxID=861109 RepID=A0A1L5BML1_SPHIB|nr:hypothetical protein [Sphingobium indicum]APL94109.1 hypothetical protein SIDU_06085 [Sphingobium indicum B90A]
MEHKLPTDAEMLQRIETFCAEHSLPPTTFGRLAVGDGNLVTGLRRDRSMTLRTGQRIIDFMASYRAGVAEKAA